MYVQVVKFGRPENGWMEVTYGSRKIHVSDVPCDSLFGLVKAMTNFVAGSRWEEVEWSLEPKYEKWIFDNTGELGFFRIVTPEGENIISATNPIGEVSFLIEKLEALYAEHFKNHSEIEKNWSWDFPIEPLNSLKERLAEHKA